MTADCWARLRAARRRGFLPFLGMMVLVGFTELIAIGVGLVRLKGLLAGPPPQPIALTEVRGETSEPEMGKIIPAHRLMGKMKRD